MVKIKMVKIANDIVLTSSADVLASSGDVLAPSGDMVAVVDGGSAREEGSLMSLLLHQESLRIPSNKCTARKVIGSYTLFVM